MAGKHLALFITLVAVMCSENSAEEKVHHLTFEKFLKDAVDITVDTFNRVGRPPDDVSIYDVVSLQITNKRMKDSWWYDHIDMDMLETNCTKINVTSIADCVVEPVETGTSTDPSKPVKKSHRFGTSLASNQHEAKFDKYLQDAINLAIDTFNEECDYDKLYDVVTIKTTVKRVATTDLWIYDRLELILRETDCEKKGGSVSLEGCVVIEDKEPITVRKEYF